MTERAADGNAATLQIENLSLAYRRRGRLLDVVDDVSLEIAPGEAYGLVGESGCGKTTIAMAVMRYLPRNAIVQGGQITVAGHDVLGCGESELRRLRGAVMAMVYQDPGSALNPAMKIGDQVAEVYRVHRRMSRGEARDASWEMLGKMRIVDPAGAAQRYPHELSGGQQQRVMLAMALATDPQLLILDEPTTGLDATVEAEVLDLVTLLREQFEAAVLFVSHNLGIVSRLCDRVGVLYAGRLVEESPSAALFAEPRHPYTAGLLQCLPRLGMRKDTDRLSPIPGSLPPIGYDLPGCVYAARCPLVRERCRVEAPPPVTVGERRFSCCHYTQEVPGIVARRVVQAQVGAVVDEPLLQVEHVRKTYRSHGREIHAVDDVSLEIRRGEVFGLVGESGSGKSSLARCIAGLSSTDGGEIRFADEGSSGERHRRLQMIFQNPDNALNPRRTIRRQLRHAVRRLGGIRARRERDERITELTASVRLEPRHLEVRPAALSGGLKQRACLARAFAGTPSLVLCDEPVSALDVSVQAAILNLLADLQRDQHVSYLFISHDLAVVRYLADRIAVMYLGQIVDHGTAEEVFSAPHHPYTETLLSALSTVDRPQGPGGAARIRLGAAAVSSSDPSGSACRFASRCPRAMDICRTQVPPWQQDGAHHQYLCHIPPDELGAVQAEDEPTDAATA
ncbi:MAG: ABC transporter ATP-binding protein [Solirubrobacteraceae bacterium]